MHYKILYDWKYELWPLKQFTSRHNSFFIFTVRVSVVWAAIGLLHPPLLFPFMLMFLVLFLLRKDRETMSFLVLQRSLSLRLNNSVPEKLPFSLSCVSWLCVSLYLFSSVSSAAVSVQVAQDLMKRRTMQNFMLA